MVLLVAAGLWLAAADRACAQVSVDRNALDQLGKPNPAPVAKPHRVSPHHKAHIAALPAEARPATPVAKPVATAPAAMTPAAPAAAAALPQIPTTPPRVAAIPPPAVLVPTRPAPPPPPIPVVADAPGVASPIADGTRVTFGPDRSDLNPATVNALRGVAQEAKANPTVPVNVAAYAAGTPEDPSAPRRMSLSRALAARAVLINEGLASTRIYVRALGTNDPSGGPSDRVDVTLGPPPQSDATPAKAALATAGTSGAQSGATTR
jgi:outer membrane protein OmpA-like peptidoglycan-associated protein